MREFIIETVLSAGRLLRERFGRVETIRRKEQISSIVTEVDLASEALILERLHRAYPDHNIIAEESGSESRGSEYTWVVDPLDGTSNYAAGIPWYGVMVAVLRQTTPVLAAMHLPHEELLYVAQAGMGATRNDRPIRVSAADRLDQILIAYAVDGSQDPTGTQDQARGFGRLLNHVRNVRATNCLVDFALTIDGRLGGFINHSTRLWDIAPAWLVIREAGGEMTDLHGQPLSFSLGPDACDRNYSVMGANPVLLAQLARLMSSSA